jgi:UDP-2-acetamido-3-amino-2,3-dideoxy-glucuronate N-acetyltransferase
LTTPNISTSKPLPGVAVIGTGYWGKNLVRVHQRLGALKLICDKDETVLARFKEIYPEVEVCLAVNDILERDDIQAVVIATPAETHFALAQEALLAGKHVYVEKPLALDPKEAEALVALAEEQGRVLMVGHLLQHHPVFVELKRLAQTGELGRINYMYSHRLNLGKIRREENILWSFAPHDISMILSLANEAPERVLATGGYYLHSRIADVTTTHLEFASGLKAHIFVSWLHPFKVQQLVVVGDKKMAVFDDTLPWADKLLLYPHEIKWQDNLPVPARAEPERPDIPENEPLLAECEHFLACAAKGETPITDGREGLQVLRVLDAAQRSLDEQRTKGAVALPPQAGSHASPDAAGHFVHESAIVDENVSIGEGTKVWHFSHVLGGSVIGRDCNIGQNVVVGPDVTIGKGCKIQNNVSVYKGVTLEDEVFCGPSMVFTNVFNPRAHIKRMDELRPTLVKQGTTLGANSTIVCGVTIGRYAFVGAGAVVTKNVLDHALMAGNPARRIGWVCACGEKLEEDLACSVCGTEYREEGAKGLVRVEERSGG